jgi:hypothetical protein
MRGLTRVRRCQTRSGAPTWRLFGHMRTIRLNPCTVKSPGQFSTRW